MRALRTTILALVTTALLADCALAQLPERPLPRPVLAAIAVSVNGAVGFDSFYGRLGPYGHWTNRPHYGWAWSPGRVAVGWRPYTVGHWAYSDYGWTWVSGEPWGWATYHYGRWYDDPSYGWTWVPGNEWGPAWVSWQQGGDYVGWAALPPAVGWDAGVGLALGGLDLSVAIAPSQYCFVGARNFLAPNVLAVALPIGRNVDVFRQTRNITRYNLVNNRVVNTGFPVERVEQMTGRRVPRFTVASASRPTGGAERGNELSLYRPRVAATRTVPSAAIQRDGARFAAAHQHNGVVAGRGVQPHRTPATVNQRLNHNVNHSRPVITNRTVHRPPAARKTSVTENKAVHTPRPPVHHVVTTTHAHPARPQERPIPPAEHIASQHASTPSSISVRRHTPTTNVAHNDVARNNVTHANVAHNNAVQVHHAPVQHQQPARPPVARPAHQQPPRPQHQRPDNEHKPPAS